MKVYSCQADAMEAAVITVESEVVRGFGGVQLIGNVSEVCRNGIERARTAIESTGRSLPQKRVLVSFSPANLKKEGSQFDLAMAVSLFTLECEELVEPVDRWMFVAELGLNGDLRPVKSVVSYYLAALAEGFKGIVLSSECLSDLASVRHLCGKESEFEVRGFSHLEDILEWIESGVANSVEHGQMTEAQCPSLAEDGIGSDFDDMVLDPELRKIAEAIATGMHSLILSGTPGTGKSMFAARLPCLLPAMAEDEHLDALRISSAYHHSIPAPLLAGRPPFRSPHHQASAASLLGTDQTPGELSLAHGGVLFLDEFPEFRRDLIEALREPLETGTVHIARARRSAVWDSKVILVAAANNCPCGWYGSQKRSCRCATSQVAAYRRKISGPILDRIDIHFNMPERKKAVSALFSLGDSSEEWGGEVGARQSTSTTSTTSTTATTSTASTTATMVESVRRARHFSEARNLSLGIRFNRDLKPGDLSKVSGLSHRDFSAMIDRCLPQNMSSRSAVRAVRVARSLADLDQADALDDAHLRQAYRWQAEQAARKRGDHLSGLV